MPADQGILDSVTNSNVKNLGDQPAKHVGVVDFYRELAMRGATEAANGFSGLFLSIAARASKVPLELSPEQSVADYKLLGDAVASQLQQIGGALAGLQEMVKAAQTVPPISSPAPVTK